VKDGSAESIGCLGVLFFVILLVRGWQGVKEATLEILLYFSVFYMAFFGLPFLKRYIFDRDLSYESKLSRAAHAFVLKPLSFILLIFSAVFCGSFIINYLLRTTAGRFGD
jgi:hypothetical protein